VILFGEGRKVPSLDSVLSELDEFDCLDFGRLLKLYNLLFRQSQMLIVMQELVLLFLFPDLSLVLLKKSLGLFLINS
jgi:hypothetical protein